MCLAFDPDNRYGQTRVGTQSVTEKEITYAEKIVRAYREQSAAGVGVFTVDGKMIDIAFIPGAERTLKLARACGLYEGDLV